MRQAINLTQPCFKGQKTMSETKQTTTNPFLALFKDKMLSRPETWKAIQNVINLLAGTTPVLMLLFPQYQQFLTPEFLAKLTMAVGAINGYLTTATTGKVGI